MFVKLEIQTRGKVDLVDITAEIQNVVTNQDVEEGICFVYCPHTTAGIVLNENWDPSVEHDIAMVLNRMIPENLPYRHSEGNSPGHIKSVLIGSDHFMFVQHHQLQMGRWQGIFLADFDGPRRRSVWVKIVTDAFSA